MLQIAYNRTVRTEKPRHIVIHTTGNKSKGANAMAHFNYWNRGEAGASADFVVDDKEALQINDYNKYYTWHCGDGKGKYGITNANSIGIEICVNSDGNFENAVENAVKLVKKLKKETGITKVVRHYDASRKNCPAEFSANNWAKWREFLEQVEAESFVELTEINDLVWELAERGIVTDKELWLTKLTEDINVYWIIRKCVNFIRRQGK
ncbi:MAG: N-acetylmuramoyl-L-alanine amidase [Ruminococcaceae bacterium]|nr:N-acetylmuramoyl-L-alanine amidase [Oscillospiraceae bacterium]